MPPLKCVVKVMGRSVAKDAWKALMNFIPALVMVGALFGFIIALFAAVAYPAYALMAIVIIMGAVGVIFVLVLVGLILWSMADYASAKYKEAVAYCEARQ